VFASINKRLGCSLASLYVELSSRTFPNKCAALLLGCAAKSTLCCTSLTSPQQTVGVIVRLVTKSNFLVACSSYLCSVLLTANVFVVVYLYVFVLLSCSGVYTSRLQSIVVVFCFMPSYYWYSVLLASFKFLVSSLVCALVCLSSSSFRCTMLLYSIISMALLPQLYLVIMSSVNAQSCLIVLPIPISWFRSRSRFLHCILPALALLHLASDACVPNLSK
jgi:hypothetical protein